MTPPAGGRRPGRRRRHGGRGGGRRLRGAIACRGPRRGRAGRRLHAPPAPRPAGRPGRALGRGHRLVAGPRPARRRAVRPAGPPRLQLPDGPGDAARPGPHPAGARSTAGSAEDPDPAREAARMDGLLRALFPGGPPASTWSCSAWGPDGHVASLFPGGAALEAEPPPGRGDPPRAGHARLTLTIPVIRAARAVLLLASRTGQGLGRRARPGGAPDRCRHSGSGLPRATSPWWLDAAAAAAARRCPLRLELAQARGTWSDSTPCRRIRRRSPP